MPQSDPSCNKNLMKKKSEYLQITGDWAETTV